MSLREELNRAIDAADHYDRHGVMPTWARMALTKFVGNNGQVLLDALEDAGRYRWLRDEAGDTYDGPYIAGKKDKPFCGEGWITGEHADQAIDAAIKGDG